MYADKGSRPSPFTSLALRPDDSNFRSLGRKKIDPTLARSSVIGYARRRHLLDVRNRGVPDHLMSVHADNRRFYFRLGPGSLGEEWLLRHRILVCHEERNLGRPRNFPEMMVVLVLE